MQCAVIHTFAQNINHAALADLAAQAREKFQPRDVFGVLVIGHADFLERLRLRGLEKLKQLRHVERVGAVVIFWISSKPARTGSLG